MSRSSIFNFEALRGFNGRWPRTLACVLLALAGVELLVRALPEEKIVPPKSRQGEIFFIEREVLPQFPEPRIVFLGSSRIRRAVVPRQLDEQLGLPPRSTLNAGLASGRVFESLYMYRRNAAQFGRARLVVLNVDEWHLSTGWRLGSLYETHAPFAERLRMPESIRTQMVLDGLFTARIKLELLPRAASMALGFRKPGSVDLKLDENYQILPPVRKNLDVATDPRVFHDTVDDFYSSFALSPVLEGHVEQLAAAVRASGGTFMLMQLPNRAAYQNEVNRLKGPQFKAHLAALKALAARIQAPLYIYESPAEIGLEDSGYVDYGHINIEGSKIATRFLGELIAREGWLGERR